MITITDNAAEQIKLSARQGNIEGMALRIAVTKNEDNSFHYGMGFDDSKQDDIKVSINSIDVVIAPESAELLKEATLDYVELEPGKHQFIFMNPNDPDYRPPAD